MIDNIARIAAAINMSRCIDAIGAICIFVLSYAAFGLLAGGLLALPLGLLGNQTLYMLASNAAAIVIAIRITRATCAMLKGN